jgi:coenzyme F420 hydrogenase subunit beta
MFAFFCAGVPSRRAVRRVVEAMGLRPDDLESFRFRGEGWPGKAKATTCDGQMGEMSYEASWGGHLSKDVQFRCKICPDAIGGVADIACADAWYGGETGYPQFEEQDGRSLVISRTTRGENFLAAAVAAGAVTSEPLALDEIRLMQPSQARRRRLVEGRVAALKLTLRPTPRMTGLLLREATARARLGERVRNFLGSVRRSVKWRLGSRR